MFFVAVTKQLMMLTVTILVSNILIAKALTEYDFQDWNIGPSFRENLEYPECACPIIAYDDKQESILIMGCFYEQNSLYIYDINTNELIPFTTEMSNSFQQTQGIFSVSSPNAVIIDSIFYFTTSISFGSIDLNIIYNASPNTHFNASLAKHIHDVPKWPCMVTYTDSTKQYIILSAFYDNKNIAIYDIQTEEWRELSNILSDIHVKGGCAIMDDILE